jgi:hypothetical protein
MRRNYPEKKKEFEKKFIVPSSEFLEFSRPDIEVFVEAFREFDIDGKPPRISFDFLFF